MRDPMLLLAGINQRAKQLAIYDIMTNHTPAGLPSEIREASAYHAFAKLLGYPIDEQSEECPVVVTRHSEEVIASVKKDDGFRIVMYALFHSVAKEEVAKGARSRESCHQANAYLRSMGVVDEEKAFSDPTYGPTVLDTLLGYINSHKLSQGDKELHQ